MAKKQEGELLGYVEIGGYAGVEGDGSKGRTKIEPVAVSVNKELNPGFDAEHIKRVFKRRIDVIETRQDSDSNNGGREGRLSAGKKVVDYEQYGDEKDKGSVSPGEQSYDNGDRNRPEAPTPSGLSPLQVLKNMVDTHADNIRWLWTVLVVVGVALGIVGAVAFLR